MIKKGIALTQHRRATEGVQQAAVGMSGLAFGVEQAVGLKDALHAALAAAPDIGLFHPFAL